MSSNIILALYFSRMRRTWEDNGKFLSNKKSSSKTGNSHTMFDEISALLAEMRVF